MGFLDKLLGRAPRPQHDQQPANYGPAPVPGGGRDAAQGSAAEYERGIARYRYLLRTASPDQLEAMHAEAFEKLTPEQRQELLRQLSQDAPAGEQVSSDSPRDLARAATRAEMRQPGALHNTFSRGAFGGGMGGTVMGSMMGTVAGVVVGSMIANSLLDGFSDSPEAEETGEAGDSGEAGDGGDTGDGGDAGDGGEAGDSGGGFGGDTYAGDDFGGGDFGGGDFGGGDFGGGDFGGF